MCPNGHHVAHDAFDKEALRKHLRNGAPLRLHCEVCESEWDILGAQREALLWALENAQ